MSRRATLGLVTVLSVTFLASAAPTLLWGDDAELQRIVGATLMTRLAPRTIYLVFPSVYVLAGVAVVWSLAVLRRILGSGWWRERVADGVVGGATAWLLVPTLLLRLGFLWGDLRVSALWWPYQP